jgi:hypothetical protein
MGEGAQLFNLKSDIGEKQDLAAQQPEKLKELESAYAEWNKSNVVPTWTPGNPARFTEDRARRRGRRQQRQQQTPAAEVPKTNE